MLSHNTPSRLDRFSACLPDGLACAPLGDFDAEHVTGSGLIPGEETVLAVVVASQSACKHGFVEFELDRELLETLGAPELITYGITSGTISTHQTLAEVPDVEPLFHLPPAVEATGRVAA